MASCIATTSLQIKDERKQTNPLQFYVLKPKFPINYFTSVSAGFLFYLVNSVFNKNLLSGDIDSKFSKYVSKWWFFVRSVKNFFKQLGLTLIYTGWKICNVFFGTPGILSILPYSHCHINRMFLSFLSLFGEIHISQNKYL